MLCQLWRRRSNWLESQTWAMGKEESVLEEGSLGVGFRISHPSAAPLPPRSPSVYLLPRGEFVQPTTGPGDPRLGVKWCVLGAVQEEESGSSTQLP